MLKTKRQKFIGFLILIILCFIALIIGVSVGSVTATPFEVIKALFGIADNPIFVIIIQDVRLPRVLVAALVGITLGLAGVLLQSVMRNPMAGPSVIGVTSGSSLAAYLCIIAFPFMVNFLPIATFVGGLGTTLLIYLFASRKGSTTVKIILAGLAISSLFGAINDLIRISFPDRLEGILGFLIGSLNNVTWGSFWQILPFSLVGIICIFFLPRKLNILSLGDENAKSLGINTERLRLGLCVLASLLASATVSIVGLIGFVGILVPHLARILFGSNHKHLIPATVLIGASLLMLCDTVGRIMPVILPVGIIMPILGAPFFISLLIKGSKTGGANA